MLRAATRILALAIGVAFAACAPNEKPVVRRPGPSLCKEGPPAWSASDGRQLMYRTWGPAQERPRAVIVGVPGWNGTAGDIAPLGRYLAGRGMRVYSTGVRGQHGDLTAASLRTKGQAGDGRLWERDFYEFAAWVRKRHPKTPLFLYGQSMGSLTAILVSSEMSSGAVRAFRDHFAFPGGSDDVRVSAGALLRRRIPQSLVPEGLLAQCGSDTGR